MNKKQKWVLARIIVSAVMLIVLHFVPVEGWLRLVLYMIPYLVIGYDILRKAVKGILNLRPFDENFLMAVATVGAVALGDYAEGAAVMLFYQIGELFQSVAVGKSRRNIRALLDLRPDGANLVGDGEEVTRVSPEEVAPGSIILVRPGERVPIDGVLLDAAAQLDTSALTGESVPRAAHEGEEIQSGCINLNTAVHLRTTRPFGESTVSKILELMENAGNRKSRSEDFITKFARIYTPAVCFGALALAIFPPLWRMVVMSAAPMWSDWIYRALTFLVISCPCALVISIPLTFFAALGGSSRAGVLVKGSAYMETLAKVRAVVFDKTGTLTHGVFEVTGVHHATIDKDKILEYAALAECESTHPIANSLCAAYGKEIDRSRVKDVEEISGHGVKATVDGHAVAVGNEKLMHLLGLEEIPCHEVGTLIHVAVDGAYVGHILIADRVKEDAADAIQNLKKLGVSETVMLTGDNAKVGETVAQSLGMTRAYCQLLPADKVSRVEELLEENRGKGAVAFVGDGINDAPVLTRADVGIAMGALGSDAAIEAADVVLMNDKPTDVARAMTICRRAMRIVYENIVFALVVKAACLILGATGHANMWLAIFADVGVMVLAVLNAIRALRAPK